MNFNNYVHKINKIQEFCFRRYSINIKLIEYKIATTSKHYIDFPYQIFYFKVLLNGIVSMYIDVYNIAMYSIDNSDTHTHVL